MSLKMEATSFITRFGCCVADLVILLMHMRHSIGVQNLVNGKLWKGGDLRSSMRRGEVSFSHRVMEHFITAFFWLGSSSDIINPALCESKSLWRNCNTAVFQQKPQTITHSKHFVAKRLCMQIWDQFRFLMKDNVQVQSGGLLLFTLCSSFFFNSFIIKGFLSWRTVLNSGLWKRNKLKNWDFWIQLPFILCSLFLPTNTHIHTHCFVDTGMQKDMHSLEMHWNTFFWSQT